MSDYKPAALMLGALPPAAAMIGDRGYDAGWFCGALAAPGVGIPSTANWIIAVRMIEHSIVTATIENMFGRLKTSGAFTPAPIAAPAPLSPPLPLPATVIF